MKILSYRELIQLVLENRSICENNPENLKKILKQKGFLVRKNIYRRFSDHINIILDNFE